MLKWIDGFEGYAAAATGIAVLLARRYTGGIGGNIYTMKSRAGRWGGYCCQVTGDNQYMQTPVVTTDDTLVIGFAFQRNTAAAIDTYLVKLYDGATLGMSMGITAAGELYVASATTVLATSAALGLGVDVWYYLEFKVKCNDTTGTYEVRCDGTTILMDDNLNTKSGANDYHDRVRLGAYAYTGYSYFDDFYIADGSGSVNNTFIGQSRVIASDPDGEFATNWSTIYPANGSHYTSVDDGTVADDDTTYVEDNTSGHQDIFEYSALTLVGVIRGVAINTTCEITDVNPLDLVTVVESDGNTDSMTTTLNSTGYKTISEISETDPNTSSLWVEAGLNAAHFGFEVG